MSIIEWILSGFLLLSFSIIFYLWIQVFLLKTVLTRFNDIILNCMAQIINLNKVIGHDVSEEVIKKQIESLRDIMKK